MVGGAAAELGLEKVLNFFNANHEVSPELYVAMAQGEAAEIIQVQSQGDSGPTQLKSLVEQGQENGLLGRPTLKDIVNRLQGEYTQPYLPLIETVPSQDGEERLRIAGMAIFRDGKLLDTLSIDQTRGCCGQPTSSAEPSSRWILGSKTAPAFRWSWRRAKAQCRSACGTASRCCAFPSESRRASRKSSPRRAAGWRSISSRRFKTRFPPGSNRRWRKWSNHVFFSQKSDIFRYSEFIRKEEPDYWKQHHEDFEQVVEDCTFEIDVECIIDHPGLEASHTQENS